MKALILAPFHDAALDRLRSRLGLVHESWTESRKMYDPEELGKRLAAERFDIVVVEIDFLFEETFAAAPGLKFVGMCRAALNQVDMEAATRHGVAVVNAPHRNANAVAEHAVGLLLGLARRIPQAHGMVASGRWDDPFASYVQFRGTELAGKTAGIIGLGAIGAEVAKRLRAFEMRIIAYDPLIPKQRADDLGVVLVSLDHLLQQADVVSAHVPLTADTERMLSTRQFAKMKPGAYLVNVGAGGVIDEEALATALREGRIAGAALDVFAGQPLPPSSPLIGLDNVVLTPHIGGATKETVERYSASIADDILRFLAGERPLALANPQVWAAGDDNARR